MVLLWYGVVIDYIGIFYNLRDLNFTVSSSSLLVFFVSGRDLAAAVALTLFAWTRYPVGATLKHEFRKFEKSKNINISKKMFNGN